MSKYVPSPEDLKGLHTVCGSIFGIHCKILYDWDADDKEALPWYLLIDNQWFNCNDMSRAETDLVYEALKDAME
jgi:hypothetical protein